MTFLHSVILGIVEGITEFLPISSTGHMILASSLLGISNDAFTKTFEVVVQLGAILAVAVLYVKTFLRNKVLVLKVGAAFVPTAVIGLMFYKIVKTYLLGNVAVVAWALILGGIALIVFEYWHKTQIGRVGTDSTKVYVPETTLDMITYKQSVWIGVFQALAIVPGVSRSAATIIGGQLLGISRIAIVEFSFLLALPTMLAASGLDLLKTSFTFSAHEYVLLAVGLVTAFVVALVAVKSFLAFIQKHSFVGFGIYRIVVGLAFLLYILR